MADRYVALRIRPRRNRWGAVGAVAVVAVLALALAMQLWLLVLGVVTAALVWGRSRRRHRKRLLPALLAGRALLGRSEPAVAVEEWAKIWLAVLAGGRPRHLRRAARLVKDREDDPWRAHVATARLEAAEDALTSGGILGLTASRHGFRPSVRVAAWAGIAAMLLTLSGGATLGWLLAIGTALAGLTLSLNDLQEARALPRLLATQAGDLEVMAGHWEEKTTSVPDLIVFSGGDHRCLRHARELVENHRGALCGREAAGRQLRDAESTVREATGRYLLVSDGGLHWWIGSLLPALGLGS